MEQEIKTPEEAVQNTRRIGLVILAVLVLLLAVGGIVLKIALTPDDAFERILQKCYNPCNRHRKKCYSGYIYRGTER